MSVSQHLPCEQSYVIIHPSCHPVGMLIMSVSVFDLSVHPACICIMFVSTFGLIIHSSSRHTHPVCQHLPSAGMSITFLPTWIRLRMPVLLLILRLSQINSWLTWLAAPVPTLLTSPMMLMRALSSSKAKSSTVHGRIT